MNFGWSMIMMKKHDANCDVHTRFFWEKQSRFFLRVFSLVGVTLLSSCVRCSKCSRLSDNHKCQPIADQQVYYMKYNWKRCSSQPSPSGKSASRSIRGSCGGGLGDCCACPDGGTFSDSELRPHREALEMLSSSQLRWLERASKSKSSIKLSSWSEWTNTTPCINQSGMN